MKTLFQDGVLYVARDEIRLQAVRLAIDSGAHTHEVVKLAQELEAYVTKGDEN